MKFFIKDFFSKCDLIRSLCQKKKKKMADLDEKIFSKNDEKFNELKLEFLNELKDRIEKEVSVLKLK